MTNAQADQASQSRPYDRWLFESIGEMRAESKRASEDAKEALLVARELFLERNVLDNKIEGLTTNLEKVVFELSAITKGLASISERVRKEEIRPRNWLGFDAGAVRTVAVFVGTLVAAYFAAAAVR